MSNKYNHRKDKFEDSLLFQLNPQKPTINLNDSVDSNKALKITIEATHGGYINRNFRLYRDIDLQEGVNGFTKPNSLPILEIIHGVGNPIGRVINAKYEDIQSSGINEPTSKIIAEAIITDADAISKIQDKRYLTVSTGATPVNSPICSICKNEYSSSDCSHYAGHKYDIDGVEQLCYLESRGIQYNEITIVNIPADKGENHVAGIYSLEVVDKKDYADILSITDNQIPPSGMNDDLNTENKEDLQKQINIMKDEFEQEKVKLISLNDEKVKTLNEKIKSLEDENAKVVKNHNQYKSGFEQTQNDYRESLANSIVLMNLHNQTPAFMDKIKDVKDVENYKKIIKTEVENLCKDNSTTALLDTFNNLVKNMPFTIQTMSLNDTNTNIKEDKVEKQAEAIKKVLKMADINL